MDISVLDDAHGYWFGPLAHPADFPADKAALWFRQDDQTDREIAERFGAALPQAAETEWSLDRLSRRQIIGLIVLLDQFPRNIHREDARAFAFDACARRWAQTALKRGTGRYYQAERFFLYLPFEHSEHSADQDLAVKLFADLALEAPEHLKEPYRAALDYATKHRDLIRRFGRFPHRNSVLNRRSTAEETAFLESCGRGF